MKIQTLEEVCDFVRGPFGSSLTKSSFVKSGFPVYEQNHAIKNQQDEFRYFVTEKKFKEMKRFQVNPGDILMSCSGTIGKTTIIKKNAPPGIINQALLKIAPKETIKVEYLNYYMKSDVYKNQLFSTIVGTAIKNVASVKILKKIHIPVPSIQEQEKIVERLDKVFENIEEKLENLKEMDLMTYELKNSTKINFYKNIDSPLVELYDLVDLRQGLAINAKTKHFLSENNENSYPLFRIKDLQSGEPQQYVSGKLPKTVFVNDKNLVFTRTGNPGLVYKNINGVLHNNSFSIDIKHKNLRMEYLYNVLNSSFFIKEIEKITKSTVIKDISHKNFKKIKIKVPSIEKQKQFSLQIESLEKLSKLKFEKIASTISNLYLLKKSILYKEFSYE